MKTTAIVGWDGTASASRAAEWLADRQLRNGRGMALVRVFGPRDDGPSTVAATSDRIAAVVDAEAEATHLRASHSGVEISVRIIDGEPFDVLRGLSNETNIVAVGQSRRVPQREHAHTSLAERLASTAIGPVAVVSEDTPGNGRGIVVGVDGTAASLEALDFAAQEAFELDEPLEVVHAWLSPVGSAHNLRADRTAADLLRHRHEALLEESLLRILVVHPSLRIQRRVVQGLAVKILLQEARPARMLVVGNHGRQLVARFLLGSVSTALVREVSEAIVVIKTPEPSAPTPSALAEPGAVHGGLSTSLHS